MTNFEFATRLLRAAIQAEENLGFELAGHGMVHALYIKCYLNSP